MAAFITLVAWFVIRQRNSEVGTMPNYNVYF